MTSTSAASSRPTWRAVALLTALALIPRLVAALVFLDTPIGLDDMHQYDMLGQSLAAGEGFRWYGRSDVERLRPFLEDRYGLDLPEEIPEEGYRTAFRPPGYPFFLAVIYWVSGMENRLAAVRIVQAFLGSTSAILAFLIAQRSGLRKKPSWLAGLAVALYPFFWLLPAGLASENLFIPLVLATLYLLFEHAHSRRLTSAAAAGLTLGAAALTRGVAIALLPIAGLWIYRRAARSGPAVLAATAAFLLMTVPWSVRNSRVLQRPAFVDGSLSYNLFIGYHPDGDGGFAIEQALLPLRYFDDAERDRWAMGRALEFIRADPAQILIRPARRWIHLWGLEDRELIYFYTNGYFGPLPAATLLIVYAVVVFPFPLLALSAALGLRRPPSGGGWLAACLGALTLPYLLVMATARFHLPSVPLLAIFAAGAWAPQPDAPPGARARTPLAAMLVLALLATWAIDLTETWPTLQLVLADGGHQLGLDY